MYRPTTRVLAALELLQAHGQMSGAEMAARLGVGRRTLRRYIGLLEELGIPIATERGRYGGYALVPGFKLPPLMFNDDEALVLAVGLVAARGLGLADALPATASAQAKLERVVPEPLKRRVRAVNEVIRLAGPLAPVGPNNALLMTLSVAARQRQRVRLRYRDARFGMSEREFDPYGLVFLDERWYAVGMCNLRKELRSFRLDRMLSVDLHDMQFERPDQFDALGHLMQSFATSPRVYSIELVLKTDEATARQHIYTAMEVIEVLEGQVRVRNQADDLDWFARQLAYLPFEFEIVRPDELRAAVRECAQRLMRQI